MTTIRLWTLGAPLMLAGLAACDSGSDAEPPPPTFTELSKEALELGQEVLDLEPTASSDLPTEGSASYDGVMLVTTEDNNALAGEMSMEVAFGGDDPISGEVTNIVDADEGRYDGSLAISDSGIFIAEGEAGFDADLDGTLTGPDDEELEVEADLYGGFGGNDADPVSHAGGLVEGTSCGGDECSSFDGSFVVER